MHTGIQLRSDTLIIPQNTGIFAALQQTDRIWDSYKNVFSKIMPPKQALLYDVHSPFD